MLRLEFGVLSYDETALDQTTKEYLEWVKKEGTYEVISSAEALEKLQEKLKEIEKNKLDKLIFVTKK